MAPARNRRASGRCKGRSNKRISGRSSTSTCTAAHTGSYEYHISTFDCACDFLLSFFSSLFTNLRFSAGTKTVC